jgi:hypothetical protein
MIYKEQLTIALVLPIILGVSVEAPSRKYLRRKYHGRKGGEVGVHGEQAANHLHFPQVTTTTRFLFDRGGPVVHVQCLPMPQVTSANSHRVDKGGVGDHIVPPAFCPLSSQFTSANCHRVDIEGVGVHVA